MNLQKTLTTRPISGGRPGRLHVTKPQQRGWRWEETGQNSRERPRNVDDREAELADEEAHEQSGRDVACPARSVDTRPAAYLLCFFTSVLASFS